MSAEVSNTSERASKEGGIKLCQESGWTLLSMVDNGPLKVPTPKDAVGQVTPKICPFWNEFSLFSPDPAALFLDEFRRLANHMKWSKKKKREYLVKALNAEIDFHGDESIGLVRWQRLCQELEIGSGPEFSEPKSITKCKKVLNPRFVNLYSLVDHRRNPDVAVKCFDSFKELVHDIGKTGSFPRECAKKEGYMKVLLKRM